MCMYMCMHLAHIHMLYKGKLIIAMYFDIVSEQQNDVQLESVTFAPTGDWNLDLSVEREELPD